MPRDPRRPIREAWIVEALRTPVGRYGGALAAVRPDDLAALAIRAVVDRSGIDPALVEDVILGCANQAGEDNRNVARMALLLAGIGETAPASPATPSTRSSTAPPTRPARTTATSRAWRSCWPAFPSRFPARP